MALPSGLPRFLADTLAPVDFAARVAGAQDDPDGGVRLACATRRLHPEERDWYGTRAETILHEATVGEPATLHVDVVTERAVRLRYAPGPLGPPAGSEMLVDRAAGAPASRWEQADDGSVVLSAGDLVVRVDPDPLAVRVTRADGRPVWATRPVDVTELEVGQIPAWRWLFLNRYAYPLGAAGRDAFLSWDLRHDERLFGLGEGFGPLDKRFAEHELWVREGFSNATPAAYKQVPFVWSTGGWGLFAHTSNRVRFDLGAREHASASLAIDDTSGIDLFVLAGDGPAELLDAYTELTGRPRVPPRWSYGFWQGRITYRSEADLDEVAGELRERRLPADVLHLDTGWFTDEWRCDWRFDPERFPDPAALCARLAEQGLRLSVWQWPYVVTGTQAFADARDAGALVVDDDGRPALLPGEWGDAGVIDLTGEAGVSWYRATLAAVLATGVSVIKADFGEGIDPTARYAGLPSSAAHNRFPLLYNRTVFEAVEEAHGPDEAVIWARSAWAGSQRYPLHWSGDGIARFADLPCVVRAMLSFGLSGFAFYAHDVGGFSGVPSPELYVRWLQLGVFSSHVRAHGTPPREPWSFGPEAEERARALLELRMRLVPYLEGEALALAPLGQPVARALVLDFPGDRTAVGIDDQYGFGRALLVAPILDATDRRAVWLPAGTWVDFWTGERVAGGRWLEVQAGLDRIPVWARGGSVVPLGPVVQHTGEATDAPLELHVFALDAGDAVATVAGDDGAPVQLRVRRDGDGSLVVDPHGLARAVVAVERG